MTCSNVKIIPIDGSMVNGVYSHKYHHQSKPHVGNRSASFNVVSATINTTVVRDDKYARYTDSQLIFDPISGTDVKVGVNHVVSDALYFRASNTDVKVGVNHVVSDALYFRAPNTDVKVGIN